jgi:hypothetical protein
LVVVFVLMAFRSELFRCALHLPFKGGSGSGGGGRDAHGLRAMQLREEDLFETSAKFVREEALRGAAARARRLLLRCAAVARSVVGYSSL